LKIEDLKIAPDFCPESSKPFEKEKEQWKGHRKYEHYIYKGNPLIDFMESHIDLMDPLIDSP
jgi:hypothetical protein